MQAIKVIVSFIAFYFLAIFQASYLSHFKIRGGAWNTLLVAVILVNFFEKKEDKSGLIIGALAGFYLDLFSPYFMGIFTLVGVLIAFAVKRAKPLFDPKRFASFAVIFFSALLFYEIIFMFISAGQGLFFNISGLIINFLAGIIIYWMVRLFNVISKAKIR